MIRSIFIIFSGLLQTIYLSSQSFHQIGYEGGMVTHPGAAYGYHTRIFQHKKLRLDVGIKTGFYFHKNYRTAMYVIPMTSLWLGHTKNFQFGVHYGFGIHQTIVHNTYQIDEGGQAIKKKYVGTRSWVSSIGFLFSGKTPFNNIRWQINPALLTTPGGIANREKYVTFNLGIQKTITPN